MPGSAVEVGVEVGVGVKRVEMSEVGVEVGVECSGSGSGVQRSGHGGSGSRSDKCGNE